MKKLSILSLILLAMLAACQNKSGDVPVTQGNGGGQLMTNADNDIKILQDIIRKDPKSVDALIKLGNIYMDASRFAEAIDMYGKALEITPNNVDVRVDMGTCYRRLGKPDITVQEYRKALAIDPNHLNAHLNLAVVLGYDFNDKKAGIAEFEKYIELAPNAPNVPMIKEEIEKLKVATPTK